MQPDPEGKQATVAIRQAISDAGLNPADIAGQTYVSAHGTSTKLNDRMESVALRNIFGDDAGKLQISSIKSMLGHMIGAACAVEMSTCCLGLTRGVLPPTINYDTPDPECTLNYIPNKAITRDVKFAINNSFGFGGHNVSLVARKVEDPDLMRS